MAKLLAENACCISIQTLRYGSSKFGVQLGSNCESFKKSPLVFLRKCVKIKNKEHSNEMRDNILDMH